LNWGLIPTFQWVKIRNGWFLAPGITLLGGTLVGKNFFQTTKGIPKLGNKVFPKPGFQGNFVAFAAVTGMML